MKHAHQTAAMNKNMYTLQLDVEAEKRRQDFLLLDRLQKANDFRDLVFMNGSECASRQIFRLRVYDHQRRAA